MVHFKHCFRSRLAFVVLLSFCSVALCAVVVMVIFVEINQNEKKILLIPFLFGRVINNKLRNSMSSRDGTRRDLRDLTFHVL